MARYAIGLDFGTSSVRALVVDLDSAAVAGSAEWPYARGDHGVLGDPSDPNLARQWPGDYRAGLTRATCAAVSQARDDCGLAPEQVVGIGVDTTGSTPIPVDAHGVPLSERAELADDLAAMAWLWKDHTAQAEAEEITALARAERPSYVAHCGGTYSSEWFWSKILRCLRTSPRVFAAAHSFVELCDYVPGLLTGVDDPGQLRRSVCAAGHKAMYSPSWGGLPDAEFLARLAPQLAELRLRLYDRAYTAAEPAGGLSEVWAAELGLRPGTTVAVGAFDAHLGAVGAGIAEGDLVKVMGTSTCDMAVARRERLPEISGLCGMVEGSILPGFVGFEAGQSAVGDVFQWCAEYVGVRDHDSLTADAAELAPGETGLLALDWHNGNRCVLVDPALSGLLVGLHLHTRDHEIYRAMIEATAFGARAITDRIVEAGVPLRSVVACGGLASRSELVMQIYADVLARPVQIAASEQTCALGAAIMGAVAAGAFPSVEAAQRQLCPPPALTYQPRPAAATVYQELFELYRELHDAFGVAGTRAELSGLMKQLLAIRDRARRA